jgi:hypothetical protein
METLQSKSSALRPLSGNVLKLIALLSMTIDHIGLNLMGNFIPFRIIGRLAFPIFAYMIAEGCHYTRNKTRYFGGVFLLGLLCQIGYFFYERSIYQCILITFSLSILLIYSIDFAAKKGGTAYLLPLLGLVATAVICILMPDWIPGFHVDYSYWGVLLPVFIYLGKGHWSRLALTALGLILLSHSLGGVQVYSLFALIPLALYSGKRGKLHLKYLFYIYYPAHLIVIQVLAWILR